MDMIKYYTGA